MDAELIARLRAGGGREVHDAAPEDGRALVRRWAAAVGLRPGAVPGPTAGEAALLASRWAAAQGLQVDAGPRDAGAALRALGCAGGRPTTRAGRRAGAGWVPRYRIAGRALARQLRDDARRALPGPAPLAGGAQPQGAPEDATG